MMIITPASLFILEALRFILWVLKGPNLMGEISLMKAICSFIQVKGLIATNAQQK